MRIDHVSPARHRSQLDAAALVRPLRAAVLFLALATLATPSVAELSEYFLKLHRAEDHESEWADGPMLVGGALYSLGTVFHLLRDLPYQNAIWHCFVLAASACFFTAVSLGVSA